MSLSMDNRRILKTALEKMAIGNAERDRLESIYIKDYNALAPTLAMSAYFMQERLTTIIEARSQLRRNEQDKLDAGEKELDSLQNALEEVNSNISNLIKQRNEWLSTSPLSDLNAESHRERQNMDKAREGAQKIDREVADKLPEFEGNIFYDYLKSRGFGTDSYNAKAIPAKLDGLLAKLCAFEENSRNEEMLQNIKNQSILRLKKAENTYKNLADSFGIEVMKMEKEIGLTENLAAIGPLVANSEKLLEQLKTQIKAVSEISSNTVNMYTRAHMELGKVLTMGDTADKEAIAALRENVAQIVRTEKQTASMLLQINNTYEGRISNNKKMAEKQGDTVKMGSKEASSILPTLAKAKK